MKNSRVIDRYESIKIALDAYRDTFRRGYDRTLLNALARVWVEAEIGLALAKPGEERTRAAGGLAYVTERWHETLAEYVKRSGTSQPASAPVVGEDRSAPRLLKPDPAGSAPAPRPEETREDERG